MKQSLCSLLFLTLVVCLPLHGQHHLFMHWCIYSPWGIVDIWSLCPEDEGWTQRSGKHTDSYFEFSEMAQRNQPGDNHRGPHCAGEMGKSRYVRAYRPGGAHGYSVGALYYLDNSFGYERNNAYNSPREIIHSLGKIVSCRGNYLLNIAPIRNGEWDQEAYNRLAEEGERIVANGEGIFATDIVANHQRKEI